MMRFRLSRWLSDCAFKNSVTSSLHLRYCSVSDSPSPKITLCLSLTLTLYATSNPLGPLRTNHLSPIVSPSHRCSLSKSVRVRQKFISQLSCSFPSKLKIVSDDELVESDGSQENAEVDSDGEYENLSS